MEVNLLSHALNEVVMVALTVGVSTSIISIGVVKESDPMTKVVEVEYVDVNLLSHGLKEVVVVVATVGVSIFIISTGVVLPS